MTVDKDQAETVVDEILTGLALQYVEGFIVDQGGPWTEFLFQDTATPDYQATAAQIGVGDGTTTSFAFCRALRNTHEPVGYVFQAGVSSVTVNGVAQVGNWSVTPPNLLTFTSAPAAAAVIAAAFQYYWRCTFASDTLDMDEFMTDLFELKELKFESLPSATSPNIT